ncbi:aspartate racemase [Ahniella affigens]|uniref:Aspartate racemase n=1 Tax=Ahniella affigens TaxID=2021234 RepID=A0A2P1PLU2_9GAMM|nr:aspartate/glutamate racemase family protein [Ahniella affigens]AVP95814.1 aspartate racemase [Ahniella affigens]
MYTIGLIGGMSWESTIPYYRLINETIKAELGGLHSAKIVLFSVDFHEIEVLQRQGDWDRAGQMLADAAKSLQAAGADVLVLCTNTMHKVAAQIASAVAIPLLHIADATGVVIRDRGHQTVGLLGTRFTMEQDFYSERLRQQFGLRVLTPQADDRALVHRVIYEELCLGRIEPASQQAFRDIIQRLIDAGAEAVILGCTEISLLVGPADAPVPVFDTTAIHARAAAHYALRDSSLPAA